MKKLMKALFVLFVSFVAILALAYFFLQTSTGKDWLAKTISERASTDALTLRVEHLGGRIPLAPTVGLISLADPEGEWLRFEKTRVSWSLGELLQKRLHLHRLHVEHLEVHPREAEAGDPAQPADAGRQLALPPVRVDDGRFGEIAFGENIRARGLRFNVADGAHAQTLKLSVSLGAADLGDIDLENLSVDATVAAAGDAIHGDARLAVEQHGSRGSSSFRYSASAERLALEAFTLKAPGTDTSGDLEWIVEEHRVEGAVNIRIEDASPLAALVGQEASGRAIIQAEFSHEDDEQRVRANGDISGFISEYASVQRLNGVIDVADLFGTPRGRIELDGDILTQGDLRIDELQVALNGDGRRLDFRGRAAGHWQQDVFLVLTGRFERAERKDVLALTACDVRFGEVKAALVSPLSLTRTPHPTMAYHLAPTEVALLGARCSVEGTYSNEAVNLLAQCSGLELGDMPLGALEELAGTAELEVRLRGDLDNPSVKARAGITRLRSKSEVLKDVPEIDIVANATLEDAIVNASANLRTGNAGEARAELVTPLEWSIAPRRFEFDKAEIERMTLNGVVDLGFLNGLPSMADSRAGGRLILDISYRGEDRAEQVRGTCRLEDGLFENYVLGTVIQNAEVNLVAAGTGLTVESATANDGNQGVLTAAGHINLDPSKHLPYALDLRLDRVQLLQGGLLAATASGHLDVQGTATNLGVRGDLTIDPAHLNVDNLPPAPPALLVDKGMESKDPAAEASEPGTRKADNMDVRIDVSTPGAFFVRGRSLDTVWSGKLRFASGPDHWVLLGDIEPRRGSFSFLGRQFRLEESKVRFDGSWPPSPTLDLSAVHQRGDVTARLKIRGRPENPEITIESEPPMPEDEIFSYVLFGRNLSTVTALQAVQIASAVRSMRGGGGIDAMDRMRSTLGVDRIELREHGSEEGQAEIAAGRQLASGLYLELNRSLGPEGGSRVLAEYELRPNLTIETDVGANMRSGVMVNWRRDY